MNNTKDSHNITVVTVTLNAGQHLERLAKSLNEQTFKNFVWLVKDGGSTDNTKKILEKYTSLIDINLIEKNDDGIYSALNQAISYVNTKHYIVAGADDFFYPTSLQNFSEKSINADIVCAPIRMSGRILERSEDLQWRMGIAATMSSHSIGCLIKKSLHEKFGLYDTRYNMLADQNFLLQVYRSNSIIEYVEQPSGEYSLGGYSSSNKKIYAVEFFRMSIANNEPILQQILLLFYRFIKLYI
jgi:glycosyltransferase involved in cell wall biosynthesis